MRLKIKIGEIGEWQIGEAIRCRTRDSEGESQEERDGHNIKREGGITDF